jgi:predicted ATP-grasp superfamily ATP-dependent carboligase
MDNKTFSRQIKNQKKHWWFQARKKIIDQIISSINLKKKKYFRLWNWQWC